ncbi:MAG TPA: substrate-binding domain-containing protein [Rugosimonospora sp.]|nr:substrate-binding domain-containing protein [Rugosimonospora sp.]
MKRIKAVALATAVLACGALVATAGSASADQGAPQAKDIVGAGSDTIQYALDNLADGAKPATGPFVSGYNASASARLVSIDATKPGTGPGTGLPYGLNDVVQLRASGATIARPNGSGAGKNLLYGPTNNTNINFARSSGANSAAENSAGLWMFPFAVDGLSVAANAGTTNAPAAIDLNDVKAIYTGAATTWGALPDHPVTGAAATRTIHAYIPQVNSGTRNFFIQTLGITDAQIGGNVLGQFGGVDVEEHDPSPLQGDPDAIAPFSEARANTAPALGEVQLLTTNFYYTRAVYNVVRAADLNKTFVGGIFGPTGFICSSSAKALINAAGFQQLQSASQGGACGVATQTAPTNLAHS